MKMKGRGFTLAELLIVITVIAIILGIAIPRLAGMRQEGQFVQAAAELGTLRTAVESYYIHNNQTYPVDIGASLVNARPQIVGEILMDPLNGNGSAPYSYAQSPNSQYYVIWSEGIDDTSQVTGIDNTGTVTPANRGDDLFVSNGDPSSGGF